MKIPALLTCLLAAVLSALPMSQARADDVSFDVFYNSLADDGDWYNTPEYGYVWQPSIGYQNDKWRPYSDGYWAQTDDGWTWVSYENFGWATYHYGRWTNLEGTGWVWVPGYEWGPGWVSWRTNDDYVGWAPLPPKRERRSGGGGSGASVSVDYNTVESEEGYDNNVDEQYDIGPDNYCFVQTADFGAPVLREVIVPPARNLVIIENTVNVTHITYRRGPQYVVVHNDGPDFVFLRTRVHRPIQELRIERRDNTDFLRDRGRDRRNPNIVRDGVFQIAAPRIDRRQVNFTTVKPPTVKREIRDPRVDHGWRNTGGDQATVQRVRDQFQQQARERATRPPGNQMANATPAPQDNRRDRDRGNVPPTPGATPAASNQPFNRTEDDRRARRDAAQRDREARQNGHTPDGQPTPGADRDTRRQPGGQPTPGAGRDARRQPGNPDQAQPSATPQGTPGRDQRRRDPRQTDATPGANPTPAATASPRVDRQNQRRVQPDAQPSAAPSATPQESRRGPRSQDRAQTTPPAADQTPAADRDRGAARRQEQQDQTRAREAQQQQRAQEQATQRQQDQAQRQQAAQQRAQDQARQQEQRSQQEQAQRQQQGQQRQQEQAQREQQAQQRQQQQQQQAPAQNQPAKSDDDKKKRRDGQSPQ